MTASLKKSALVARDFVRDTVAQARQVILEDIDRGKYFRVVATVVVDGQNIADLLVENGLGRRYDGGSRNGWCGG